MIITGGVQITGQFIFGELPSFSVEYISVAGGGSGGGRIAG